MKILEFVVELVSSREILINGQNALKDSLYMPVDEKLFRKLHPDQQWAVLCELRKMEARLAHAYDDGRVARGELTLGDASRLREDLSGSSGFLGKRG